MRRFVAHAAIAAIVLTGCTSVKQYPEATRDELWVKMKLVDGTTYRGALLEFGDDSLMLVVWDEPEPDITVAVGHVVEYTAEHRAHITGPGSGAIKHIRNRG